MLDAHPEAAGCSHDADVFDSDSGRSLGRFSTIHNGAPLRSGGIELLFDPTYKMLPSATMIRAAFCPSDGFDERLKYTDDWLFDIEVFRHGRCIAIDDVFARYRRHGDNFTTREDQSGVSFEEGLMTMALVTARYPELRRRAGTVAAAIMLGQAPRHAAGRAWGDAARCGLAAYRVGGLSGVIGVGAAVARSMSRRARAPGSS